MLGEITRLVPARPLAAMEPTPVANYARTDLGERPRSVRPEKRRARRAVYAKDRCAMAVDLVVEIDPVHMGDGHDPA